MTRDELAPPRIHVGPASGLPAWASGRSWDKRIATASRWSTRGAAVILTLIGIHASPSCLLGQVIQLPTWRVFAIDTSVLVPDQGAVLLGGVSSARDFSVHRGVPLLPFSPLGSAARQHALGAGMATVSATIIDHHAWDEALLAQARAARGPAPATDPVTREAAWISQRIRDTRRDLEGRSSIAQLAEQAQHSAASQRGRWRAEVASLLRHGDACLERGQYDTAKMFYRSAWRQSEGTLREQVEGKLSQLRVAQEQADRAAKR